MADHFPRFGATATRRTVSETALDTSVAVPSHLAAALDRRAGFTPSGYRADR